jgi:hypothetical protein
VKTIGAKGGIISKASPQHTQVKSWYHPVRVVRPDGVVPTNSADVCDSAQALLIANAFRSLDIKGKDDNQVFYANFTSGYQKVSPLIT